MEERGRYLLLIGCSERKHALSGLVPAIDFYDGVNYRVLHKAKQDGYCPATLQVLILSAKHALLDQETLIEYYDQRMTREQALTLQQKAGADLDVILTQAAFDEVFLNLGKLYLRSLATSQELPRLGARVHYATDGIGERMAQMKHWLIHIAGNQVPS